MPSHLLHLLEGDIDARPWLERQLVGPDLLQVAHELAALHGETADAETSAAMLEARRPGLLEHGLQVLAEEEVQALFRNPSLLFRLQEWVLVEGGPYWDGVLSGSISLVSPATLVQSRSRLRTRLPGFWAFLSHAGAAAAAALLVWHLSGTNRPAPPVNGSPEIAAGTPAEALLPLLAEQIDREWSVTRRAQDPARALQELQQSCEALAVRSLPQLSAPARSAVRRDLIRLAQEIETQRRILERGGDVRRVRAVLDSRVNALLVAHWRDPGDLPDSGGDPDDLPSSGDAL